ncbi:hypothetical protein BDP67DRAFT_255214 [Colletotrichum lupini]|nr:hypothetical protein BDP67DRAFT_255214 [Colletotrichum lupini]
MLPRHSHTGHDVFSSMYCGSFPAWAVPRSVRRGPLQGPQCRRKSSSVGSLFLRLRPFFQRTVGYQWREPKRRWLCKQIAADCRVPPPPPRSRSLALLVGSQEPASRQQFSAPPLLWAPSPSPSSPPPPPLPPGNLPLTEETKKKKDRGGAVQWLCRPVPSTRTRIRKPDPFSAPDPTIHTLSLSSIEFSKVTLSNVQNACN